MPPFRIFVSSPVDGIEDFRIEIMAAAAAAEASGHFKLFFYEDYENERVDGQTICESIFASTGEQFDALFVFFKDRVGSGTIEELEYFESRIIPKNQNCKIWWSQIHCENQSDDIKKFKARLLAHNTGLPVVRGHEKIEKPNQLAGRLTKKIFAIVGQMLRQV